MLLQAIDGLIQGDNNDCMCLVDEYETDLGWVFSRILVVSVLILEGFNSQISVENWAEFWLY